MTRTVLTIVPEIKSHSESDRVCVPATSVQKGVLMELDTDERLINWETDVILSTCPPTNSYHHHSIPEHTVCLFIISGPVQPWVVCAFIAAGPAQHKACFITLCWDGVVVSDPAQPLSPAISSRSSQSFSSVFAGFLQPLVFYPDALQYG